MNDRTLRKLNPNNPNDTLSLESVITMYVRLFIVCEHCMKGGERFQEFLLLLKSFVKVYLCTDRIPPDFRKRIAKKFGTDGHNA